VRKSKFSEAQMVGASRNSMPDAGHTLGQTIGASTVNTHRAWKDSTAAWRRAISSG